jgi:polyhydroxybutyrate depolymerase
MNRKRIYQLATAALIGLPILPLIPAADSSSNHVAAACSRALQPGNHTIQVRFGNVDYPVRVHVPAGLATRAVVPVVVDLHPSGGNAERHTAYTRMDVLADQERFVTVRPNGNLPAENPNPNKIWFWNVPNVPTVSGQYPPAGARNDIAYLTEVIDKTATLVCADPKRIHLSGHSGGARMASAYACARPDKIASFAAVVGLRSGRPSLADLTVPELQSCTPTEPVPVIAFHGTNDTTNPYQGNSDARWGYTTTMAVHSWARINDCKEGPVATTVSTNVTSFTYSRCDSDATITLYRVTGGTHSWPGSTDPTATQEINATNLMWTFFKAHPRH